ncbi:MAG: molybdopterin molybdotransferase MoeA [Phycisphaerae bacterium]|nr:molybdopterin molybdotransferase MoeA [Phycisphaerae bacterium]
MGFRGQAFAFESPAAAVEAMIARLADGRASDHAEPVPLDDARGRILAEAIACDRDSPPFDHSAMDGYAIRTSDLVRAIGHTTQGDHVSFPVVDEARIGSPPPALPESAAIRIVTGAAVPAGADAVVRREEVSEHADGGRISTISIAWHAATRVRTGDSIRRRGENARAGDAVLRRGVVISSAALGTLAATGCVRPRVYARVRAAIITTGDELVPPHARPAAFQIRNSNAPTISATLGSQRWMEVVSVTHSGDEPRKLEETLRDALGRADAVVLTGGVSIGHRDPVREAVEAAGAEIVFHGLPQRPGKPILGAVLARKDGCPAPIFALPGNPVSAMVTCTRIVLPVLAVRAGSSADRLPSPCLPRLVPLTNPDGLALDLWWHRLARLNRAGEAELIDARGSGDIIAAGCSDGFLEFPPLSAPTPARSSRSEPPLVPFFAWPF